MKKIPNPMSNIPKELTDYIKQYNKTIEQLNCSSVGFDKGTKQQEAERLRINKELSTANRMIKEQKKEIKRMEYNLRNLFL